jgi:signal transduction histidine kinase
MARGDSVVTTLGMALGAVVLVVLAVSSWWTLHTYRLSLERGREQELRTVAQFLPEIAGDLLTDGKVGITKNVLAAAAQGHDLTLCRIVLADGKTIADANPRAEQITPKMTISPPRKATGGEEPLTLEREGNKFRLKAPFTTKNYGVCTIEVEASVHYPLLADPDVQIGIGATGVIGMVGLLGTFRLMRRRLRGLSAIGDALMCAADAEGSAWTDSRALRVSESFGEEARAWNALLDQRDALRQQALLEQAAEKLQSKGAQGVGGGDLASACDALWTGLVILDAGGQVRYANGAAGVMLRRKRDDLIGAGLAAVVEDTTASEAIAAVAAGKTRQRTAIEIERRGEPGTPAASERTLLRLTARPLRREDGAGAAQGATAIVLVEDVTQSRVADESRNAFVAQATHELRTPLTNIRLYVETMVEDGENDAAVRSKCLNVINQEVRRLERIVADMLSVSEIEAGSLKLRAGEIRLDALFEEVRADFAAQAEDKEIKLVFDLPPKYPLMSGDRDKLLLALNNLVGNALKYTPTGGAVTVRVEATSGSLVVDVSDNGIGIAPEEQELVFEKFYRAKDRRISGITGSGIGLALARQVARLHQGDITVKSQLDKGSTFTLTVPLNAGAGAVKPQALAA